MDHKSLKAWGLFFEWLTNKYSVEYSLEWIDWYFKSDDWRAYWRGYIKAPIYQQSLLKVHFEQN
jgi:hypothetical protein